jgi:hypothetical protein
MSTTIEVYPAIDAMPLVEQTRARTEELFQRLLTRRGITSTLEVRVSDPNSDRPIPEGLRWEVGMELVFGYWVDGVWDSSSWPRCSPFTGEDQISERDLVSEAYPTGYAPELLGRRMVVMDLTGVVDERRLAGMDRVDHYWYEYRNAAGPAVASTGYGLAAAALAEATDGVLMSWDSAFDIEHNGETADRFLSWWGDSQVDFYGDDEFRVTGTPNR